MKNEQIESLLKISDVTQLSGFSKASIYRLMNLNKFPKALDTGTGSVRWRKSAILAWQESLIESSPETRKKNNYFPTKAQGE